MNGKKHSENIKTMSATIRSFSYLIKRKSLFFELLDELALNKDSMSMDELTCYLIRMFGGTTIRVPSVNELRLYQYLLNTSDKYLEIMRTYKNPRSMCDTIKAQVLREYHGELNDVEVNQVIIGFIEAVTDIDFDIAARKHDKVTIAKRLKDAHAIRDYNKELTESNDDCPIEDDYNG